VAIWEKIPRLGFAFFGHFEMVMLLIPGLLSNFACGLKGENGENFCCIFRKLMR
jgi:hypothetical protein